MGEKSDQIERHIESARNELGGNLQELEGKVKAATDWRLQFDKSPMTLIGVAFGGGVLLSTLIGGRSGRRSHSHVHQAGSSEHSFDAPRGTAQAGTEYQKQKASDTWDNIKGALIGVAATKFKQFLGESVPGFHEEFGKTETGKNEHGYQSLPAIASSSTKDSGDPIGV